MDNELIIWKWNPATEEWELPKFPKKDVDRKQKLDIIIAKVIKKYGEALRKLKD